MCHINRPRGHDVLGYWKWDHVQQIEKPGKMLIDLDSQQQPREIVSLRRRCRLILQQVVIMAEAVM